MILVLSECTISVIITDDVSKDYGDLTSVKRSRRITLGNTNHVRINQL